MSGIRAKINLEKASPYAIERVYRDEGVIPQILLVVDYQGVVRPCLLEGSPLDDTDGEVEYNEVGFEWKILK